MKVFEPEGVRVVTEGSKQKLFPQTVHEQPAPRRRRAARRFAREGARALADVRPPYFVVNCALNSLSLNAYAVASFQRQA